MVIFAHALTVKFSGCQKGKDGDWKPLGGSIGLWQKAEAWWHRPQLLFLSECLFFLYCYWETEIVILGLLNMLAGVGNSFGGPLWFLFTF